ncbi:photosynthetic NDH subunit of lumenal location 5, chloroplastic-like isoform X2 [Andrographis paniculata]|uniref:photosynthetic NDH subunit of lumenal location 5, chloroplastic-like isoform X2 n=1 Tax=Andrographis paniculata TaxID=175694 RepID=UPI0021E8BF14|nr:photosynthetic NDH subunit of lumenal location 5, chloroplastic-like isoform X2 [Andrographis paniculata]
MAVPSASLLSRSSVSDPTNFSRTRTTPIAACSFPSSSFRKTEIRLVSPARFSSASISLSPLHLLCPVRRGMDCRTFSIRITGEAPEVTKRVYLEVRIGEPKEKLGGRIEIELYGKVAPKTVENFRALCTGEKGFGYKGSTFDHVIKNFYIHGGAFRYGNGKVGRSIYGAEYKEETKLSENGAGNIVMKRIRENDDAYGSQFLILTNMTPTNPLVFGKVSEKSMNIVKLIEEQEVDGPKGRPKKKIVICKCGEIAK